MPDPSSDAPADAAADPNVPDTAKLRAPSDFVEFNFAGVSFWPNKKGLITVPVDAVPDAISHGLIWPEPAAE